MEKQTTQRWAKFGIKQRQQHRMQCNAKKDLRERANESQKIKWDTGRLDDNHHFDDVSAGGTGVKNVAASKSTKKWQRQPFYRPFLDLSSTIHCTHIHFSICPTLSDWICAKGGNKCKSKRNQDPWREQQQRDTVQYRTHVNKNIGQGGKAN